MPSAVRDTGSRTAEAPAFAGPSTTMPARDAYDAWLGAFVEGLEWYGIRPDEAGPLAEFMLAALEGALVLTRVRQSTEPLARVARQVSTVVPAAAGA